MMGMEELFGHWKPPSDPDVLQGRCETLGAGQPAKMEPGDWTRMKALVLSGMRTLRHEVRTATGRTSKEFPGIDSLSARCLRQQSNRLI